MSAPQPNAPSLVHSQGAPSAHPMAGSPHEMSLGTYVPASAPPPHAHAPAPAPATQIAADVAVPAPAASVSSLGGRPHSSPRSTASVTRTISALPELASIQPAPIPVFGGPGGEGFRRSTAHYADSETFGPGHNRDDQKREKCKLTVSTRLEPTIVAAKDARKKAERTARLTSWLLHIATGLQVLIGALTTALGAALSGKHTSVAISTLGGASTLVAAYLARSRSTNEPEASHTRVANLKHFLREVEAFQLDHESDTGYDDEIKGFRIGLEHLLVPQQPRANQPGQAGANSGTGAIDPKARFTGAGMLSSSQPHTKMEYFSA